MPIAVVHSFGTDVMDIEWCVDDHDYHWPSWLCIAAWGWRWWFSFSPVLVAHNTRDQYHSTTTTRKGQSHLQPWRVPCNTVDHIRMIRIRQCVHSRLDSVLSFTFFLLSVPHSHNFYTLNLLAQQYQHDYQKRKANLLPIHTSAHLFDVSMMSTMFNSHMKVYEFWFIVSCAILFSRWFIYIFMFAIFLYH